MSAEYCGRCGSELEPPGAPCLNCEKEATAACVPPPEPAVEAEGLGALGWFLHMTMLAWCLLCLGFLPVGMTGIFIALGAGRGISEGPVGSLIAWAFAISSWVLFRGSFKAHRREDSDTFRKYLRACTAVACIESAVIVSGIVGLTSHAIRKE